MQIKVYKSVILPAVFYVCEIWSLTVMQESRLRVLKNRMLRKIFGPQRDGIKGEWGIPHNEELYVQ
jgi:hypothetical protein